MKERKLARESELRELQKEASELKKENQALKKQLGRLRKQIVKLVDTYGLEIPHEPEKLEPEKIIIEEKPMCMKCGTGDLRRVEVADRIYLVCTDKSCFSKTRIT